MRISPRTLRTSLVVATATAALSLGAASGALATPAGPAAAGAVTATALPGAQPVPVGTVQLAVPGHTAKVVRTGPHAYRADILFNGRKTAVLTAQDGSASATNLDGLNVQLTSQGQVSSWVERARPRPEPADKRVLVRVEQLADGSTARVYRLGADRYQADVYGGPRPGGTKLGTLDTAGRPAAGEDNGLHIVLNPDGSLLSWLDQAPAPAANPGRAALSQAA
ncbi:hypothetical protein ACFWUZ_19975 [Streptomyces sp. NPDC058646]|uniref:hypothetical protein n=1 Tax=Streptomyces sp. NPDC058646 TaxID=3346574 RepID=UPI003657FEDC